MTNWSRVEIFHSGDDYYGRLIEDIRQAQRTVTIETYIFSLDSLSEQILKELNLARERGCDIKLLVDGFGSYAWIPQLQIRCQQAGIDLRIFHPLPRPLAWVFNYFWNLGKYFKRFNRRTHRKITIIDEKIAYLGSLNYSAHHIGPKAWRDTGVRLEGPGIKPLSVAFHITYLRTIHKSLLGLLARFKWSPTPSPRDASLRLNTTQRMRRLLFQDLIRRFNSAEKRIYITSAYFLPKRKILAALVGAAKRGVDVRVLMPGKSDVPLVKWAAFNIVHMMRRRGVRLYEYQKSILHAKSMIIDNTCLIGSMNINYRSFVHDLEVEVVLDDPQSLQNMTTQWDQDLNDSHEISPKDYSTTNLLTRFVYKLAFRLRYML